MEPEEEPNVAAVREVCEEVSVWMGGFQFCFLCMKNGFLRGLQNTAVHLWSSVILR